MNRTNLLFIALTTVVLFGCGRETLQDNVSRTIDRDSENAALLSKRFQYVVGSYTTDATQDTSPFWITLDVKKSMVQKDGFLTPQPTLSGNFTMWTKSKYASLAEAVAADAEAATAALDPAGVSSPFSNGLYDQGTQQMVLKLPGSGDGIQVSCNVKGNGTLNCEWLPNAPKAQPFGFVLAVVSPGNVAAKSGK